jgi:hypothetical protein
VQPWAAVLDVLGVSQIYAEIMVRLLGAVVFKAASPLLDIRDATYRLVVIVVALCAAVVTLYTQAVQD